MYNAGTNPQGGWAERARAYARRILRCRQLYLMILPSLITLFIFHYIPIYGVQIAFKNFRSSLGIWGSPWVGLSNIQRFFTYPDFWKIMRNTIVISLYSLLMFPLSIIFSLMLNEVRSSRLKKTVQLVTYAPHFVSTVVVASMILLFLDRSSGVVNSMLRAFGVEAIPFMSIPEYFASIYVWSGVWQELGWGSIIYLAALSSISQEQIESAQLDGANRLQVIWHINIPSILPMIIIMLILRTGSLVSVGFEKVYLLQNPLNLSHSRVLSTYVYEIGLLSSQFSYSAAIGLFNNVINVVLILLVNFIARRVSDTSLF